MKNQNNGLSTKNWFYRIKTWWHNFFSKSKLIDDNVKKEQTSNCESAEITKKENDWYTEKYERKKYLLDLQRKYKNNEILEENIIEQDRIDLENLFIEQNDELKRRIIMLDRKISKITEDNRKG